MLIHRIAGAFIQATNWAMDQIPLLPQAQQNCSDVSWENIPANQRLHWHPCHGDFTCARLQVPMDWHGNSSDKNRTVEIALIRVAATVPITDSRHGGAVLFNPGGPGGSGVRLIKNSGHKFRTLLSAGPESDAATAKYFDIIGFDPRGVGMTSPFASAFADYRDAARFAAQQRSFGMVDTSDAAFDNIWASMIAASESASGIAAERGIGRHMSTAPVARDIIEIVERYGEWREQEACRSIDELRQSVSSEEIETIIRRTSYQPGNEQVQYWGFSYGTLLGMTLAATFPDRIKRAVFDGVVDAWDYMAGTWKSNLRDTDDQIEFLGQACFSGGPVNCAIYHADGPGAIVAQVHEILANLKRNPVVIPRNGTRGPDIVSYVDLQLVLSEVVYHPQMGFSDLAQILAELASNNGTTLLAHKLSTIPDVSRSLTKDCKRDGPFSAACEDQIRESDYLDQTVGTGIMCTDASPSRFNQTKESYQKYVKEISSQSELLGARWASIMMRCVGWSVRPAWRYEGTFTGGTVHPVLFIGNTIDPVTPLINAVNMSKGFEGARVLQQDSAGHCSVSALSLCSARVVRDYFQSGKLPKDSAHPRRRYEETAYCATDRMPLDGYTRDKPAPLPEGETDIELWDALLGLVQDFV